MLTAMLVQIPTVVSPGDPPPPIIRVPIISGEVANLDVEVRDRDEVLFKGPLRVAAERAANYNRETSDAPPNACPNTTIGDEPRLANQMSGIRVTIMSGYRSGEPKMFTMSVRYTRPLPVTCPNPPGTRTWEIAQRFALARGSSASFASDGLSVTVRRRE